MRLKITKQLMPSAANLLHLKSDAKNNGNILKSNHKLQPSLLAKIKNCALSAGTDTNFITCGVEPQPADYALAQIAADVYCSNSTLSENKFQRLTPADLKMVGLENAILKDKNSGFQANLYTNNDQIVLAFAGTKDLRCWLTNLRESLGLNDPQYQEAIDLARLVHQRFGNRLLMTGHSLGGSLASTAALATGSFAVTFNAAGVAKNTLYHIGIKPERARFRSENGSIRSYSEEYDPLSELQHLLTPLPKVLGHQIVLKQSDDGDKTPLPAFLSRIINGHKMREVITSIKSVCEDKAHSS